jgi:hypothetical protein
MPQEQGKLDCEQSQYTVDLLLPSTPGQDVTATVVTRERPFALMMITHQIVGDDPITAGGPDPENYSIDWSIQNEKRYWKGGTAPMARAGFGSTATGVWITFPQPIPIEAKTTLFVTLQNRYPATAPSVERNVQVIFHGVERTN